MIRKATLWFIGALALVSGLSSANAAMLGTSSSDTASVLYSQSQFVQGSAGNVATLHVPSAGELFVTLTDLNFPNPFAALQFALTDSSAVLGPGLSGAGTVMRLDLTGPQTLYADVFALAKGQAAVGLYNLTATFVGTSPVPLPGSIGLLLIGCLATLELLADRRGRALGARVAVTSGMA